MAAPVASGFPTRASAIDRRWRWPPDGLSKLVRRLPAPLGPMIPKISPRSTVKDTSSTATVSR